MDYYKFISQSLTQNLLEILDDDEYYDITIEVEILRYIYSGVISLDEYNVSDIIKILVAAEELGLKELIILLQYYLIENKPEWMKLNFNDVYRIIFENNSFSELRNYCNKLISDEPDKIFKSLDLSSTPEKLLIKLIQTDNLKMSEVQVWDHVVKWGHAKNPELPSDPTNFLKEDFNTLKNSLQQFIEFIDFYNLTSEEFSDKVLPYRKILSKELYNELLKHYLKPNNQSINRSNVDSINSDDIESYTLSRVKDENNAIFNYYSYGPVFGYRDLGLFVNTVDSGYCRNGCYENQIRKTTGDFLVEEYEIFQVIK
ncbi:BTB/POZ protein [Rhizophagus irregularis DAOM 181602=DAOM 197198]|nr:BTB/POZ protein [Rhizophagus irregularis DAOM 181602=DAOM 197198]